MNRNTLRVTACACAAVIAFSGCAMTAEAAGSSVLPSGGIGLTLTPGSKLTSMTEDSSQVESIIEPTKKDNGTLELALSVHVPTEEDLYRELVIAQVTNYVNVRSIPSTEGEVVGKLYNNSVGTFISEEDGWYQIKSGNVTGYVKAEYCVTGDEAVEIAKAVGKRIATVTTQTLFVRQEPTTESSVIGMLPLGEELLVLDDTEGWAKVDVEEGAGWVSKDYISIHGEFVQAESREEEAARLAKEAEERRKARGGCCKSGRGKESGSSSTSGTGSPECCDLFCGRGQRNGCGSCGICTAICG